MLSAIADAKSAASDSTGHAKRLESINAGLRELVTDTLGKLLGSATNEEHIALTGGQIRDAADRILRCATEATSEVSQSDALSTRKQLKDKDNYWKLKLETVRVSIPMQLRNQARELQAEHDRELETQLQDLREKLTAELASGGTEAALNQALQSVDTLKAKLAVVEASNVKLKEELESTQVELKAANSSLSNSTSRAAALEKELATFTSEAKERIAHLEEELATTKEEARDQVQQANDHMRQALEKSATDVATAREELRSGLERSEKDRAELLVVRDELDAVKSEHASAASALQEVQRALQKTQRSQHQAEEEAERWKTKYTTEMASMREELESKLRKELASQLEAKYTKELNVLKEQLGASESEVSRLEKELAALADVKAEMQKAKEMAESLRHTAEEALANASRSEAELTSCQSKLQLRLKDLSKAHNDLGEKRALIETLNEQVSELQQSMEQVIALREERDRLVDALHQADKAVAAAAEAARAKDAETRKLSHELAELRPAYQAAVEQRDGERDRCRAALQKVEQLLGKEMELDQQVLTLVTKYRASHDAHHKAAAQLEKTTEALEGLTKASKQERERIVRLSLESLRSLRRHLVTTLGGDAKVSIEMLDVKPIYRTSASLPSIATRGPKTNMIRDAVLTHHRPSSIPDDLPFVFDDVDHLRPRRVAKSGSAALPTIAAGATNRIGAAAG